MAADNYTIDVNNRQKCVKVDTKFLQHTIGVILQGEKVNSAEISLAVVDNDSIQSLNRAYLQHDYPTDVLSFVFEENLGQLVGEIVVSAEMAHCVCGQYDWSAGEELTLYVTHGTLHLVGFDDRTPLQRAAMRTREELYLNRLGIDLSIRETKDVEGANRVVTDGDVTS